MTDRLNDIYQLSGVNYYNDELRSLIIDVINDLYYSNCESICKLRINHIDRAVFKYLQAKGKRRIWNTKQYFKACILSAISELGIDELEDV
jgi:hypothetical protein